MSTPPSWPSWMPPWLRYAGAWVLLMAVCGPQTYWSGAGHSWYDVFWIQVNYWTTWAVLTPGIFALCRRLYEGPHTLGRYVAGVLLGIVAVALLHPFIENLFNILRDVGEWALGVRPDPPVAYLPRVGAAILRGSGTNPFMFGVIAIVWHARRYSEDSRERQVRELELTARLREAQLQALRSQLNPHFLFNTLHSIAELVHRDPVLAEALILRLGELLRKVLDSSDRPEIALGEELGFVRAYLDIEHMRLGDRLRLDWDIANDVLQLPVPSLLLQPLVENAVQHGIANSGAPGSLAVRARRDGGFLHLEVSDSGPGLHAGSAALGAGIGLSNTIARLQTLYGDRHSFEMTNHGGLTVSVRLPIAA